MANSLRYDAFYAGFGGIYDSKKDDANRYKIRVVEEKQLSEFLSDTSAANG